MIADVRPFVKTVLAWYRINGRDTLPWRTIADPYKIMVSEIMLQQTQVDRVIPYYTRFIKRFPTLRSLAKAPLSDVLVLWSGLGYNRRAKMLHEAAKVLIQQYGGTMPHSRDELESLPGIGPYTAGAIRAFAYDEADVCIETNIRAVLIHHFFPRGRRVPDARLVPILDACIHTVKSPHEWYAALMDYGTHLKALHPNPSRKSQHHTKQSKFEGSLRQVRGAILRAVTAKTPLEAVQQQYPDKFEVALAALYKEGML